MAISLPVNRAGQHDQTGPNAILRCSKSHFHVVDARRDWPSCDEFVAFVRGSTWCHECPASDQNWLARSGECLRERFDGFGIDCCCRFADAGYDEGQVNHAVAFERSLAQYTNVTKLAA